jgi:hypothetical protein
MDLPNPPDDCEKRLKGLIARERGHGFAEIIPEPQAYLAKLKSLIPGKRKPRRKRRRQN